MNIPLILATTSLIFLICFSPAIFCLILGRRNLSTWREDRLKRRTGEIE